MRKLPNSPRLLLTKVKKYENFKEVARSIQLVALSSLKILKKKIATRFIALSSIGNIIQYITIIFEKSYIDFLYNKYLIIIISTDKSCCGVINNLLLKNIFIIINDLLELDINMKIIIIGNRCAHRMKKKYRNLIVRLFKKLEKEPFSFFFTNIITTKIWSLIKFDKCHIFFNRYIKMFDHKTVSYFFINYELFILYFLNISSENYWFLEDFFIFNKNIINFLKELYFFNINLLFLDTLEETEYCELSARAQAMEIAVKNTKELIYFLKMQYNKARQTNITNEIIEILNASDNIK